MNALLIYPEWPDTYWSFKHALPFEGKRSAYPPLGLLTIAPLLPAHWKKRLVDTNIRRLTDADLKWADVALLSGMLVHKQELLEILARCRARGLRVFIPRPFNFLGPGLTKSFVPARLTRQVAGLGDGDELVVDNPDTRRDFVDIRDVASAYWEILTRGRPGEIYNLCTGVGVSLEEVARGLLEASGRHLRLRRGTQTDPPAALTIVGSYDKIRAELGWTPRIPLADSLRAMSLSLR